MDFDERLERLGARTIARVTPAEAAAGVEHMERALGAALPSEYRAFVIARGVTALAPYAVFPVRGSPRDDEAILDVLFGIAPSSAYHLPDEIENARDELPDDVIPVGQDPGGNLICLSLRRRDLGAVWFLDRSNAVLYAVAESWDEFMAALQRRSPDDLLR
jgi:hypothetical protein